MVTPAPLSAFDTVAVHSWHQASAALIAATEGPGYADKSCC
jgi:hypothetical protein